jgi:hypothetical protein
MIMALTRKLITVALLGFFSQFAAAQNQAALGALQEIAGIVASINHFRQMLTKPHWEISLTMIACLKE